MSRGRKSYTVEERLSKITEEIEVTANNLKSLKEARKELEEQIHQKQLAELDELIYVKGLSFDEVKKMLGCEE